MFPSCSRVIGMNPYSETISLGTLAVFIQPSVVSRPAPLMRVCCAIDSHVDRTFLIEVFLVSGAQKFLRARHHEQIPPKFSSNTHLTKGVLWPEKSIRSIKSSTVR